jgi:hypothetical protein
MTVMGQFMASTPTPGVGYFAARAAAALLLGAADRPRPRSVAHLRRATSDRPSR